MTFLLPSIIQIDVLYFSDIAFLSLQFIILSFQRLSEGNLNIEDKRKGKKKERKGTRKQLLGNEKTISYQHRITFTFIS